MHRKASDLVNAKFQTLSKIAFNRVGFPIDLKRLPKALSLLRNRKRIAFFANIKSNFDFEQSGWDTVYTCLASQTNA